MSFLAERVATRWVRLARKALAPMVEEAKKEVEREHYEAAFEAFDKFLRTIGIYGARSSDSVRITSPWAQNLDSAEIRKYQEYLREMLSIRERLREAAFPLPGEAPQLGDIEWDIGQIQHDFVEWVEPHFRDEEDEFSHGPFKILLANDARDGLEEAIKTLDLAAHKVKPKFPKVLYGKVYVTRGLKSGPHHDAQRAGSYVAANDSINLSLYAIPDRDSVMTLIHEFGHRYESRFLGYEKRNKFKELSEVGDFEEHTFPLSERRKLVDEFMERVHRHRREDFSLNVLSDRAELWFSNYPREEFKRKVAPLLRAYRDDKDDRVEEKLREALGMYWLGGSARVETNQMNRRPLSASPYGATSWSENFAESFLHYVIGKELPEPLQRFMEQL